MDKQKSTSYSSRFNETANQPRSHTTARTSARQEDTVRRPSGFGTAGQTPKAKPVPEPKKTAKPKPEKPVKEKRTRKEQEPGKNRPVLRALLAIAAAVVLVSILMVLIFGGEDTTYHQMPTIEWETEASFAPDQTPMPGVEGL